MKHGSPISEVTIPIGNSTPGIIRFAAILANDIITTPERIDPGKKNGGLRQREGRQYWGRTRSINPIVPAKEMEMREQACPLQTAEAQTMDSPPSLLHVLRLKKAM